MFEWAQSLLRGYRRCCYKFPHHPIHGQPQQKVAHEILHHPLHPYTQLLISAVPDPEKSIHAELEGGRKGEIPLWTPESHGCPFAGRCHQAMARCKESLPPVTRLADNHFVRCYLHE